MVENKKVNTSEKIMLAAIDLMSEKGYNGVTTQEIADKAGYSEKTLFRHFQSKQNLLESAFNRYHYAEKMKAIFESEITGDLYADLLFVAQSYHHIMHQNRKLIMISAKDCGDLPGFRERTHKHPRQFLKLLTQYFDELKAAGKIIPTDSAKTALAFIYLNHGAAVGRMQGDTMLAGMDFEQFVENEVKLFTRALLP